MSGSLRNLGSCTPTLHSVDAPRAWRSAGLSAPSRLSNDKHRRPQESKALLLLLLLLLLLARIYPFLRHLKNLNFWKPHRLSSRRPTIHRSRLRCHFQNLRNLFRGGSVFPFFSIDLYAWPIWSHSSEGSPRRLHRRSFGRKRSASADALGRSLSGKRTPRSTIEADRKRPLPCASSSPLRRSVEKKTTTYLSEV